MALLVWFTPGNESRPDLTIAKALRGGPVFDVLNEDQQLLPARRYPVWLPKTDLNDPDLASMPMPKPGRQDIVFAPLGMLADGPSLVDMVIDASAQLIVDVHFPLPRPDEILAIQNVPDGAERDVELDEKVRALWRDPARIEHAYAALQAADAVTVSPAGWFDPARAGRKPVIALPDVKTVQDAAAFYAGFCSVCYEFNLRPERWRRMVGRFLFRRVMRKAAPALADRVVIPEVTG